MNHPDEITEVKLLCEDLIELSKHNLNFSPWIVESILQTIKDKEVLSQKQIKMIKKIHTKWIKD